LVTLALTGCQSQDEADVDATAADAAVIVAQPETATLVVYTSRQPHLVDPLFDQFTAQTGIEIERINDSEAALIERLAAEGQNTPADVFMTVDAGNLWLADERGLLQAIDSELLNDRIPAAYRDPAGHWFGLSTRARTILYHPDRVDTAELSTYAKLADPMWQGRLCVRTSRKVYNQSLTAMMIERLGEAQVEAIVSGWVANLATEPFSSDTRLIEAIAAGQCDVGIVNTYYLGRLVNEQADYPVQLFWANQGNSGTHVNISGAGVTAHAPNPALAQQLIEWLAGNEAQQQIAAGNFEFPVVEGVALDPIVAAWGEFEADSLNVAIAGQRQAEAVMLMDRAGWR
ncbi:MAG: Fe(3+) ABC transporter substrate-binding protein, partial [Pseudomonadota bacterium]